MNGWLSPRGKFYECGVSEHAELAQELFLGSKNPEKRAEDCHWIKFTPFAILGARDNQFVIASHVTQSQINWISDFLAKEKNYEYEYYFKCILKELDGE